MWEPHRLLCIWRVLLLLLLFSAELGSGQLPCDGPLLQCPGVDSPLRRQATRSYHLLGDHSTRALALALADVLRPVVDVTLTHTDRASVALRLSGQHFTLGHVAYWHRDAVLPFNHSHLHQPPPECTGHNFTACLHIILSPTHVFDAVVLGVPQPVSLTAIQHSLLVLFTVFPGWIFLYPEAGNAQQWQTVVSAVHTKFHDVKRLRLLPLEGPIAELQRPRVSGEAARQAAVSLISQLPPRGPAPLQCSQVRPALDPRFFSSRPSTCDWSESIDGCGDPKPDQLRYQGRKFWFVGNSVTRHYGMTLARYLSGSTKDVWLDRVAERDSCRRQGWSCDSVINVSGTLSVMHFLWKDYLGEEPSYDQPWDVCFRQAGGMWTEKCFRKLFRSARPRDALVVGSIPCNVSRFLALGGNSTGELYLSHPIHAEANLHANAVNLIRLLVRTFPGTIIWHSYPFYHNYMKREDDARHGDPGRSVAFFNSVVRCAAAREPRVAFLNLADMQQRHSAEYADVIHHPGRISEIIVAHLLSMVNPEHPAATCCGLSALRSDAVQTAPSGALLALAPLAILAVGRWL